LNQKEELKNLLFKKIREIEDTYTFEDEMVLN
jgi:hypothetical protein